MEVSVKHRQIRCPIGASETVWGLFGGREGERAEIQERILKYLVLKMMCVVFLHVRVCIYLSVFRDFLFFYLFPNLNVPVIHAGLEIPIQVFTCSSVGR